MKIKPELFAEIIGDPRWADILLHKKDGTVWVDLDAYSKTKTYRPIGKGFDRYVKGFGFVDKLYADNYRTLDNLVQIESEES